MSIDNQLRILFVEDLPSDVDLAVLELRKEKLVFDHFTVCTSDDLKEALKNFKPDLIISDYMMPSYNVMQALMDVKEFDNKIPFILFTGSINEETAVKCIKAGAADYVIKEHLTRLPFAVKEALEQREIQKEKRASELLLKESEEKLQSIFAAAPVGIGLVVNRVLMEVNDKFSSDTGVIENEKVKIGGSILIAEDDEANFFYLNAVLKRETDVTILHASNGREAIELFKNNPGIMLILMDIKMPIMDGFEATKQIKLLNKDIPILAITAYAMLGDEKRVFDAGCDGYLSKPINRKLLVEKVAEFIPYTFQDIL